MPEGADAIDGSTAEAVQEALVPLASLIRKSEKAQQRLAPGSWQHAMLAENLRALRLAAALMGGSGDAAGPWGPEVLQAALTALASMAAKARKAQARFAPGTSHHSLQRNRLAALGLAEARVRAALEGKGAEAGPGQRRGGDPE